MVESERDSPIKSIKVDPQSIKKRMYKYMSFLECLKYVYLEVLLSSSTNLLMVSSID